MRSSTARSTIDGTVGGPLMSVLRTETSMVRASGRKAPSGNEGRPGGGSLNGNATSRVLLLPSRVVLPGRK